MYKDIKNIIHKYHHNLILHNVLDELTMKHITYNHKCHICNKKKLTINRKPCINCNIYVCEECEDIIDFNISKMMCGSCMTEQFTSIVFITIILFIYLLFCLIRYYY